jgi:hypothetical protein
VLRTTSNPGLVAVSMNLEKVARHSRLIMRYEQPSPASGNGEHLRVSETLESGGCGSGELDSGFPADHGEENDLVEVSVCLKPNLHEGRLAAASLA